LAPSAAAEEPRWLRPYYAQHHINPEFATFGDSLWWGIVTFTTVGYGGDIVPKTTLGRWARVMIMLSGIAVVGILPGSLASFFRVEDSRSATIRRPSPTTPASRHLRRRVNRTKCWHGRWPNWENR
jgi:voltage-gated potassium channel Kch